MFLMTERSFGQIKERQTPQKAPVSKPITPQEPRADVYVKWSGKGTVIVRIDDKEATLEPGGSSLMSLRTDKGLELYVQIPGKKFYATEFLKVDSSGGSLSVNSDLENAYFTFESTYERELRLIAERKAAEERALQEKKRKEQEEIERKALLEKQKKEEEARQAKLEQDRIQLEEQRKKDEALKYEREKPLRDQIANMVLVKGGTYTMGCTDEQNNCAKDEKPDFKVTLSDFKISKYEVTQELWTLIMGTSLPNGKGGKYAMHSVSWDEAIQFIVNINKRTGLNFRLPTEAEWEFAARGGNYFKGYRYSGGDNPLDVSWNFKNSSGEVKLVGQKAPNELGLYDMSGNVWEWCNDYFDLYSKYPAINPKGASSGLNRVLRGGSWKTDYDGLRVSFRGMNLPSDDSAGLGFRLAM
jgi:formylglycine-generating enzyme required for sulfatase activity